MAHKERGRSTMKTIILLLALFIFLSSCTALKKETYANLQQNEVKTESSLKQTRNESLKNQLVIQDSLSSGGTLTIWPKGVFTFSPETGFKGEATQVKVAHQLQQVKFTKAQKEETLVGQLDSKQQNSVKAKSTLTETRSFKWQTGFYWILLIILGLIGVLYWLFKRLKSKLFSNRKGERFAFFL